MVWREPKTHRDECYFCLSSIKEYSAKNLHRILMKYAFSDDTETSTCEEIQCMKADSASPPRFKQQKLNNLKSLRITCLHIKCKESYFVQVGTNITFYRNRNLLSFFSQENILVFCNDIRRLRIMPY